MTDCMCGHPHSLHVPGNGPCTAGSGGCDCRAYTAPLGERTRALAERAAAKRARRAQMEQARSSGLRLRRTEQLLRIARERNAPYIEENQ